MVETLRLSLHTDKLTVPEQVAQLGFRFGSVYNSKSGFFSSKASLRAVSNSATRYTPLGIEKACAALGE